MGGTEVAYITFVVYNAVVVKPVSRADMGGNQCVLLKMRDLFLVGSF